jgi:hypothetical protein
MCLPNVSSGQNLTLEIAADYAYEVFYVSNNVARTRQLSVASGSNNFWPGTSTFHILPPFTEQCQMIEISVHSFGVAGSTPYTNPAGVSYHLHMDVWY